MQQGDQDTAAGSAYGVTQSDSAAIDIQLGGIEFQILEGIGDVTLNSGDAIQAARKAYDALPDGGRIILIDVPKESSYGIMYNLALALGTWDHPLLEGVYPPNPYPIEFVKVAAWRTTAEKVALLEAAGFGDLTFAQTLTSHPLCSNDEEEQPVEGYGKGDYVAVTARKCVKP